MQQMFNAVPSSPQHLGEQVAQFRYAEWDLSAWSFFLHGLAEWPRLQTPAWPG